MLCDRMLRLGLLVVCVLISPETLSAQCTEGMLRLANTSTLKTANAGRLEVCVSDVWGTIQMESSQSFWSEKNMLVACRQLLFDGALNSVPASQLGPVDQAMPSVPVHYTDVICTGTESVITDCDVGTSGLVPNHRTDVYLVCWPRSGTYNDLHSNPTGGSQIGDIRLVGHVDDGRGAVEISTNLGWSTICSDSSWTDENAIIICELLGYESGTATIVSLTSTNVADRLVSSAQCSTSLPSPSIERINGGHCSFLAVGRDSLSCTSSSSTYAGVVCSNSIAPASVRLFGLDTLSNDRVLGVVEYLTDSRWGVLCRPSSTRYISEAICEGLGYNTDDDESVQTFSSTQIQAVESRLKPLWISSMTCDATDTSFSQCTLLRPLGYGTCGSGGNILVVDCGPKNRGLSSGTIAAIVVPTLIALGFIVFLFIKKDEWIPKVKASSWYKNLSKCLSCEWAQSRTSTQPRSRPPRTSTVPASTSSPVVVVPSTREETASTAAAVAASSPPPEEPALNNPELSSAAPPSYVAAFDLPNPSNELPPPYSTSVKGELGPPVLPSKAYPVPHSNPAYPPPGGNPAYPPPGGNPAYPPPGGNPAYPPPGGNPAYPPPGGNPPYPPLGGDLSYPASIPYPTPVENMVYPTSLESQIYPAPPPSTAMAYMPPS